MATVNLSFNRKEWLTMNQTMQIEIDMLKGDINRMCVTTDKEELKRERLGKIAN